jgi:class 3 adenylate cyclase/tetratricopeptide (TPR) repeat protein
MIERSMNEMSMDRGAFAKTPDGLPLEAFVPTLIRQRIALDPSPPTEPTVEHFRAALLLADLSGFSGLAEKLAQRGPRGAEDLKDVLNSVFGRLVDLVEVHGGQVLRFPGDAALALWPADERDVSSAPRRAVACALAAQQALDNVATTDTVHLHLRVGIGLGQVWAASVGGVAGRWELLVTGEPLTQAVQSLTAANPGEVAVSAAVWEQIAQHAKASRLADGRFLVESVVAPPPAPSPDAISLEAGAGPLLRAYVPRSVQARLDAGQTDWLAEFRRISVLFIRLGTLDSFPGDALVQLQRTVVAVQTAVYRYGGSINQLLADDKGTIVVCGWGLALHAHADDEVRAVRAALDLRRDLTDIGVGSSYGVATGEVFTGLRGNRRRCEFAMIGDVVNVAARLMQAANEEIFCDSATFEGAAKRIEFETLEPVRVKGRQQPVPVYRPIQLLASGPSEIVGRVEERRALRERLETLVTAGRGGVVFLEGDAGIGKSRLVADVIERAVARGVRSMVATGDAIERSAPYHVWRDLFDKLLGLEEVAGRGGAERRVRELLESDARLPPFAPLLNSVLRLNFRETERSQQVPPRGRAELTRELLVHLFRCATRGQPMLLVLEDAHWFDSGSWALAEAIEREFDDVLLLIAMRPASLEEKPAELLRLSAREGALVLRIDALGPEETRTLLCQRLRARALTEPVARLIRDKAEGHPFFIEELAYALRDRNLIQVEQGVCRLAAGADQSVQVPNTVQVVVSSRIDQLSVPQQLTLKVASILGRTFELSALRATYPIEVDARDLQRHVEALVDRHLVHLLSSQPTPTYAFKHNITQEVAYSLLPYALRRQLHAAAAGWYERQHPDDLSPFYPLLAHHWTRAEDGERATFYLDKAGSQALGRHANEEALRFYGEAVELDQKSANGPSTGAPIAFGRRCIISAREARLVRWHRRLGDAAMNLGRWEDGRQHFERALALLRHPLPPSDRSLAMGVGRQALIQGARRVAPRLFSRASNETSELLREAVGVYERIGAISYYYERMTPIVYSLIAALNHAERIGPSLELALVYADMSNILGLVPLRRVARAYQRMARETAATLNDPVGAARVLGRAAAYRLGIGDWSACSDLEAEMTVCDKIGDSYQWALSAAVRARVAHLRGEFELAAQLGPEIRKRAAAHNSLVHQIWGIDCHVWALIYLGRHETVLDLVDAGQRLLATAAPSPRLATLDLLGAEALIHLYRAELDQARQAAERIMEVMAKSHRYGYFAVLGMSAAAETYLAVWEAGQTPRAAYEASTRVRQLCGHIERYARVNPPARARALLWRGCAEWLDGRTEAAKAMWRRSMADATRFALPYEVARAHYEMGRRLSKTDPERREHLTKAEEGFRGLKADADARRAAAALRFT